jgi:tetratricopeptide (TPR) repeat protein/predicted aspartyl protease
MSLGRCELQVQPRRQPPSRLATLAALVLLGLAFTGPVRAVCKVGRLAELAVTMIDMKPMVMAKINGVDAMFAADSGAFYSVISPAGAAEFKLKTHAAPFGFRMTGIGGEADVSVASVKVFTLAGVAIPNVDFLVGGGEAGGGSVGLLGQNVFRIGDVEYDLAKGVIRLMHEEDCSKVNLAYWTAGTSTSYSVMNIQWTTPLSPHTTGTAWVNGVQIRVMFDTGADASVLSLRAARQAGIKTDGPGVVFAGLSRGIGREGVKTWIAPVASFKIGDEEIRNTHLRIGERVVDSADMLIGTDFFLSHRVYVASKQHKLFFTYNGGPVFNLTVFPATSARSSGSLSADASGKPADEPSAGLMPGGDAPGGRSPDGLDDPAGLARRGAAFAARRDFAHAIADLTRACELAPSQPDYFYERGVAYRDSNERSLALSDFDRAIELKPDHVPALVARAESRLINDDASRAVEDLNAADGFAAKEADARLRMAAQYAKAERWSPAIAQLDLWITAHGADARMVDALRERCWMRAVAGQDLPKALDDCNAALKRVDKKEAVSARIWSGRGLVRLRLGDYDKSAADYDAALSLSPKDPWALYGRGVDKTRRGKVAEGQADMASAIALWPGIAGVFKKRGISD